MVKLMGMILTLKINLNQFGNNSPTPTPTIK